MIVNSVSNQLREIFTRFQQAFRSPYYGFVHGHSHLEHCQLMHIGHLVGVQDDEVIAEFERRFAQLIGPGQAVSYAAARMGFYELMRIQGVAKGDEVILLGATCSVMVNAVMRTGATPIFADIDPDTLGSSCQAIAGCITPRTRMIVAQHSFGIPCEIEAIVNLANKEKIFLLEDCALTLDSKVNGISVGSFGEASLFSTDHSKPLNTLTGGLIYTENIELAQSLRSSQVILPDLSAKRQQALWQRLLLEAYYCVPERYGFIGLIDLFSLISTKVTHAEGDFLSCDFGASQVSGAYPYPAKLPVFLAAIGLIEINRWPMVANDRIDTLRTLLDGIRQFSSGSFLPAAYHNKTLEIVPLRLAWNEPRGADVRNSLRNFIHVPSTWFMSPIIATKEPLENLCYHLGSCPVSEIVGPNMVNIPCIYGKQYALKLCSLIEKANI